jgi:hypothetical protein
MSIGAYSGRRIEMEKEGVICGVVHSNNAEQQKTFLVGTQSNTASVENLFHWTFCTRSAILPFR